MVLSLEGYNNEYYFHELKEHLIAVVHGPKLKKKYRGIKSGLARKFKSDREVVEVPVFQGSQNYRHYNYLNSKLDIFQMCIHANINPSNGSDDLKYIYKNYISSWRLNEFFLNSFLYQVNLDTYLGTIFKFNGDGLM